MAVETLRFDPEVREKFLAKLPSDHPADRSFRTPTVVYGIMLKDGVPLTVDSLFAFAKVSLLNAATALQGIGCQLEIVSITRTEADDVVGAGSSTTPGWCRGDGRRPLSSGSRQKARIVGLSSSTRRQCCSRPGTSRKIFDGMVAEAPKLSVGFARMCA